MSNNVAFFVGEDAEFGMANVFIAISTFLLLLLLLLLAVSVNYASSVRESKCCERVELTGRESFPEEFIFGAASSAYQYEGAFDENGKGPSMWDNFTHMYPGKIKDYSNGDIAVDSYHRYKEDVRIAKDMGLDAYRISISWPRILPGGTIKTGVNQNGVDYYNSLINELLDNGIEPFVTILHLDIPQALQDAYGGFLSPQIVHDTEDFAELLFQEYGDRVKHWITINEPWTYSVYGYAYGYFAPGRCSNCMGGDSATEPYIVMHNQLLAHSRIVNLYRDKYQETQHGKIGIAIASFWFEPYDEKEENHGAKDRALDFMLGWIMEPLTVGKYPESMRSRVGFRLPEFTKREMNSMKGSFDFIGLNYYGAMYALSKPKNSSTLSYLPDSEVELTGVRNGEPIGEQARPGSRIFIYPRGFRTMLRHIKQKYNNPLIYITENGIDETPNNTLSIVEAVKDDLRKEYILNHLYCLREAIMKDGVDVKAYFVWSLMDNFEWASGFSVRFGLTYVDYSDKLLRRYPKRSGIWFKRFLWNGNPKIGPFVSDL